MNAESNPFATRFTRPGELAFLFPPGQSAATLADRLEAQAWLGQIVGPHGTGKTTLLHTLAKELERRGRTIAWYTLHQGERRLGITAAQAAAWGATTQVIVDGYEQLSWWSRSWLKRATRRRRAGLLVTSHADAGLPTLFTTQPDEQLAQQIVAELLADHPALRVTPDDVSRCYREHAGNVREMLFALYDLHERRSRS